MRHDMIWYEKVRYHLIWYDTIPVRVVSYINSSSVRVDSVFSDKSKHSLLVAPPNRNPERPSRPGREQPVGHFTVTWDPRVMNGV